MMVLLVMFKADGTRRDFPVLKERVVIGRTNSCDLRIPLGSVSRQHCEIRVDGESVTLRDLGSSNGTFVNGSRVNEATMEPGDEITIGPVVFTLVVDGRPAKIEPVRTIIKPKAGKTAAASADSDHTQAIPVQSEDDDLPVLAETEQHSPTVDLDDPIAALEAMAQDEEEDADLPLLTEEQPRQKSAAVAAAADEDDLPVLADEAEEADELPVLADEAEEPDELPVLDETGAGSEAVRDDEEDADALPLLSEDETEAEDLPLLAEDDEEPPKRR